MTPRPKYQAYRCRACRRDFDTSLSDVPKRSCDRCGGRQWENLRVLTLREAYRLYSQSGVVFLNDYKPEHLKLKLRLEKYPRLSAWLDRKQKQGKLLKWPYKIIYYRLPDV